LNDQSLLRLKICYWKHKILYIKLIFEVSLSTNTVVQIVGILIQFFTFEIWLVVADENKWFVSLIGKTLCVQMTDMRRWNFQSLNYT